MLTSIINYLQRWIHTCQTSWVPLNYSISHFPCVWFQTTLLKVSYYYHISRGFYQPLKRPSGSKTTNNYPHSAVYRRHAFSNLVLRTLACSKVGGNPGNEGMLREVNAELSKNQENEKKMYLMFFSMRWHYTTTFRCVAVIFGFFPKSIKPMISWQPLLLYFFRFLVFAQNRPQKNDDDLLVLLEWWKGQKKITGNKS